MRDFNKNFDEVMKWEKGKLINGYSNDSTDMGGETIFGCCRKFYPKLKIWTSIDSQNGIVSKRSYVPTDDEMDEIVRLYKKNYWDKLKCDIITDNRVAHYLFDYSVNCGVTKAAKGIQSILRITVDGVIGNQTVNAINKTNSKQLLNALMEERGNYYNKLVSKNPSQKKHIKGWLKRTTECIDWLIEK